MSRDRLLFTRPRLFALAGILPLMRCGRSRFQPVSQLDTRAPMISYRHRDSYDEKTDKTTSQVHR